MPFNFADSFQQVVARTGSTCTCGVGGDSPHRHVAGCAIAKAHARWTADAQHRWEQIRAVPSMTSGSLNNPEQE